MKVEESEEEKEEDDDSSRYVGFLIIPGSL